MRETIYLVFCLLLITKIHGQESAVDSDIYSTYKAGIVHYENKLYGPAKVEMEKFLTENIPNTIVKHQQYLLDAEKIIYQSSFFLNLPEAEKLLVDFVEEHSPDPIITEPSLLLGSYYYNDRKYEKSIYFYEKINIDALADPQFSEANFKKGYSHFVLKEFSNARSNFSKIRELRNEYFYPTNYYLGMCAYFQDDYEAAVSSFDMVSESSDYSPFVPYYITQIYFSQDQFEELITYGEQALRQSNLEKRKEIRLLLGQAYFKNGLYVKALPHLEYYESNTSRLTQEEFYQLAFSQYQLKQYEKAVENFREIALLDSKLGQLVNYYLADCYIQLKDLASARTAFKKVSQMDYEPKMSEEALFNYGKLSAELNFDREGINTLVKIEDNSLYYSEARKIINEILLNSGDYQNSINIMETLGPLSDDLKTTYQIITYNRGIQLLHDGDYENCRLLFSKSSKYPLDNTLSLNSKFWLASMLNSEGKVNQSIDAFDQYLEMSNGKGPFSAEASPFIAHYIQGYNHLKLKNYPKAEIHFKNAIVGINIERENINNEYISERVLPDALLRAGDCLFKQNNYDEAIIFYNQSIDREKTGHIYAMYQRGLIEGLIGKPYEKIITLEELVKSYPLSDYADDALFQLGETYLNLGNTGPALISFNRIVTNYKGKTAFENAALLKLGLISYNQGDAETALTYYKRIFKNNPNSQESQEAMVAIEEIYIDDQGKTDEYFAFLQTIPGYELTDFTKDSLSYKIAQLQYEDAEYLKAIASFSEYLDKHQTGYYRLEARYYRGECNSILKQYAPAFADYEYLIDEGYNDFYLRSLRKASIIAYNFTKDFEKSYRYYKSLSVESRDQDEIYQAQMGALRSAFRTSNYDGIKLFAPQVINSELASWEDASSAYYYLGKASYNTGEMEQAVISFSEINKNGNNQSAEANFLIAKIYFDKNDLELAEQQINFAIENSNNYPYWIAQCLLLYGDIYIANKDLFNARAVVEAVIENYTDNEEITDLANGKLKLIKQKEAEVNRIKTTDGSQLEMDTTRNGNE